MTRQLFSAMLAAFVGYAQSTAPVDEGSFFLMARDGEQCVIGLDDEPVLALEAARFEEQGVNLDGLWVSMILRADHLPGGCVPKDPENFFRQNAWAAQGVVLSKGAVCEACGCPETWYFCVETSASSNRLKELGYAALP